MRSARGPVAVAACAVLVAGCVADDRASSTASGTLVYTERATLDIRLLDVQTGVSDLIDATHVLWVRIDDHSVGDIGRYVSSLHVAGPNLDDRTLDAPLGENLFISAVAISSQGFIAWGGEALMMRADGTVLVENDESSPIADILGVTPEGDGVIALTYDEVVRYIGSDGTTRDLATVGGEAGDLIGPYAAYTPATAP